MITTPAREQPPELGCPVRLVFRDPIGRIIMDMTCRTGQRFDIGAGVPSHSMMVGWVDVLALNDPLPEAPFTPGGQAQPDPEPPGRASGLPAIGA